MEKIKGFLFPEWWGSHAGTKRVKLMLKADYNCTACRNHECVSILFKRLLNFLS